MPRHAALIATMLSLLILGLTACGGGDELAAAPSDLSLAQALQQIDALPRPAQVQTADFNLLQASLSSDLSSGAVQRWTAGAPDTGAGLVTDLALSKVDDFNATASWSYRNSGDYNQDGKVLASDLTPIGIYFKKHDFDADWAAAQPADGNEDGQISVTDLTPIGLNLLNSIDSYMLQATSTPETEASWIPAGLAQFSDSTLPGAGGFRTFSVSNVPAVVGWFYRVVPMYQGEAGIPGTAVEYTGQGGGGGLSFEDRQAILDQIADKFNNLTATTSAGQDAELAAFIETLPHIEEAGSVDGNAWGRFDDDRVAIVCKNRAPSSGQQVSSLHNARSASDFPLIAYSVPEALEADFLWGYGSGTAYTDPGPAIEPLMDEEGYAANTGPADYNTLKSIIQDGLLYLDCPGGSAKARDGSTKYWLGMDENLSFATESLLLDDLNNQRVGYMFAADGSGVGKWKYCFGHKFVEQYMTFSNTSLVFLNAPAAGTDPELIDEFHFAGASLVLAWIANVPNDIAYAGAAHMLDRLLGGNVLGRDEEPNIRPFGVQETLFDMQARGVSAGQAIVYPLAPANPYDSLVRFYSTYTFNYFNLLKPTLEHLEVAIADDGIGNVLEVTGDFGDNPLYPPSLSIGTTALHVLSFDAGSIRAVLPDSGYSSGNVLAGSHLFVSNVKPLTEWRGSIQLTSVGPGTLTHEVIYDLHIRADIDYYRDQPGDDPLLLGSTGDGVVSLISAPDSFADVSSSGTYVDDAGAVTTWTNTAGTHVPNVYFSALPDASFMNLAGSLDLKTSKFGLFVPCQAPYHDKKVNQDLTVSYDEDRMFYLELASNVSGVGLFEMTLAPDYTIAAGNVQKVAGDITYTAVWNAFTVNYLPDPDGQR